MTEREREALKAELMREIMDELKGQKAKDVSSKCMQPVIDKWCNTRDNGHRRHHGTLIAAIPAHKGWTRGSTSCASPATYWV